MRLRLTKVELPAHRALEIPCGQVENIHFPEDGVASITTIFRDGSQVSVGMAGHDSVLGSSVFLGKRRSLHRVFMHVGGWGFAAKASIAIEEFERQADFQRLVLKHSQAQFIQTAQTAACNARHSISQRLARWLLLCDDRIEAKGPLSVSQAFFAEMLGSPRTSVSIEAAKLKRERLIKYSRGKLLIVDRAGLERKSCECYEVVRNYLTS